MPRHITLQTCRTASWLFQTRLNRDSLRQRSLKIPKAILGHLHKTANCWHVVKVDSQMEGCYKKVAVYVSETNFVILFIKSIFLAKSNQHCAPK